jgi:membrane-bound metal-dependent hydrolase YbcI (DUF457 family)
VNTPSHFFINAAIAKRANNPELARSAFLWGAITPDIPLYLLSIVGGFYFRSTGMTTREAAEHMFETLYFSDPGWIWAHHLFQAPLFLLAYALLLYPFRRRRVAHWLLWCVAGCSLHSLLDILTHYDDGPLLFFPLNWSYRFQSFSYWDPEHGGRWFAPLELALNFFLLGYLVIPWLVKKVKSRKQ